MTRLTKLASLKIYDVDIDTMPVNESAKKRRKTFKSNGLGDSSSGSVELLKSFDGTASNTESLDNVTVRDRKISVYQSSPVESPVEQKSKSIPVSFLLHRKISEFTNLNQVERRINPRLKT
jgi:hypothetical protein